MDLTCLIFVLVVGAITLWYLKKNHSHWENQNVPSLPDPLPIFGHMLPTMSVKENVTGFAYRIYKSFNSSMVGFFFMQKPGIVVRDPLLVKNVLQTNYSSFRYNMWLLDERHDPILAKNPFFTADAKVWKDKRIQVANHLSAKKLKYIFIVIDDVCDKMRSFTERKIGENGEFYECELKSLFMKFNGEVVANSAFAMEGQSFEDHPDHLSFTKVAEKLMEPTLVNAIKQAFIFFMPGIANLLGLSFLSKRTDAYIRQNIEAILKQRQQSDEAPNDFLQFSVESGADLDDILADVVGFYLDVYETSSSALAGIFYQLSKSPEIQAKLRSHVASVLQSTDGQITYEYLKKMTYLEQVVQEALRMHPPLGILTKYCTEEITLTGCDGLTCHLKPGSPVLIPVLGLHADDKYWPDPEVFNPDRFSSENQAHHVKYSFLAFAEGPRMCVGMRLGLMLVKQATASLITRFDIEHSPKTRFPLEIDPTTLLLGFKGGLWARFQKCILNNPRDNPNTA